MVDGGARGGFVLICPRPLLISCRLPARTRKLWRSVLKLAGNVRALSDGLLVRDARRQLGARAPQGCEIPQLFGANLLAYPSLQSFGLVCCLDSFLRWRL